MRLITGLILVLAAFLYALLASAINFVVSPITGTPTLSRNSCTAPCTVTADATGLKSTASSFPFEELYCAWDYGGIIGSWAYGTAHSKNTARGCVAVAVFDSPGTYVVSLVASDATSSVIYNVGTVTVANPNTTFTGTATTCVASVSTPTQGVGFCPSGAAVAQQANFETVLSTYALSGSRVCLNPGDTFTSANATGTIAANVAVAQIDGDCARAGGALPIINYTGVADASTPLITIGANACDLTIRKLAFATNGAATALGALNAGNCRILWEGLSAVGTLSGGLSAQNPAAPLDQIVLADSTITNLIAPSTPCSYMWFINGLTRGGMIGVNLDGSANCNQAVARFQSWSKIVIDSSNIKHPPTGKNVLDFHGPTPTAAGSVNPSQYGIVTDSVFDSGVGGPVFINPQNATSGEAIKDVIFDSNVAIVSNANANEAVAIEAVNVTVRNSLFDLTGRPAGTTCYGINLTWNSQGATPPDPKPTNIVIENVSVNGANCTASGSALINVVAAIGTVTINNSLAYFPLSAGSAIYTTSNCPSGCTGFLAPTLAGNSSTAQITKPTSTNPWTGTPTGGTPTSYQLPNGSYGCKAGTNVPNFYDFGRNPYPQGNYNIGAWQAGSC